MKKLSLIFIAVFILILAGNAFGQWHPDIDRVRGKIKTSKIKAKSKGVTAHDRYANLEATYRKKAKRKTKAATNGYTAQPELDANANSRKRKTQMSSKNEISIESIERRKRSRKGKN